MRMSVLLPVVVGVVAGTVGCQTTPSTAAATARPAVVAAPQKAHVSVVSPVKSLSSVGQDVGKVLETAKRQRLEIVFFSAEGKASDTRPAAGGSVSVFNAAKNGQDNYTFDEAGRVTRHQRSVGDNFPQGIWQEVR